MNSPTRLPFDLGKLTDVLRTARGFLFAFALFDDAPSREMLVREVALRLSGEVEIIRLHLSPESPVLLDQLNGSTQNGVRDRRVSLKIAYFVDGFEAVSGEARAVLLRSFQLHREALSRADAPIVFWTTEPNMLEIARRAPDFFSWRFSVFDFRAPERVRPEAFGQAVVQMLGTHAPSLIPPEELRRRVKLFEEILTRRRAEAETETVLKGIAGIHLDLGNIHYQLNEWDSALAHYQQARETYERLSDTAGVAETLIGIGNIFNNKGEWDAALAHYQQARDALERLGDTAGVARTLNNIGEALRHKGEWDRALAHFQRARDVLERLGDTAGVATTLNNIGNIFDNKGEWDAALAHFQRAREIWERLGDTAGVARTLNNIGNIFDNKGEWDAALAHYQQARAIRERLGDTAGVATTLNNIGNIFNNKGEWDAALAHYQRARDVLERLGDTAGVATTLNNIGHVYEKQGRLPDAVSLMEQCVELERRLGHPDAEKDSAYLEQLRAKALKVPSVS